MLFIVFNNNSILNSILYFFLSLKEIKCVFNEKAKIKFMSFLNYKIKYLLL